MVLFTFGIDLIDEEKAKVIQEILGLRVSSQEISVPGADKNCPGFLRIIDVNSSRDGPCQDAIDRQMCVESSN